MISWEGKERSPRTTSRPLDADAIDRHASSRVRCSSPLGTTTTNSGGPDERPYDICRCPPSEHSPLYFRPTSSFAIPFSLLHFSPSPLIDDSIEGGEGGGVSDGCIPMNRIASPYISPSPVPLSGSGICILACSRSTIAHTSTPAQGTRCHDSSPGSERWSRSIIRIMPKRDRIGR